MQFNDYLQGQQLQLGQSITSQYFWPQENVLGMTLPTIDIHVDKPTYRLNKSIFQNALYFDNSGLGRFDSPEQGYKILYAGANAVTCYVEVFARINPSPHSNTGLASILAQDRRYYRDSIEQYFLFRINANRSLILADLTGIGLNRLSGDTGVVAGPHQVARAWGQAIWANTENVDGIRYRSRLDNDQYCYGLFEDRVSNNLRAENLGRLTEHPKLLKDITGYCGHTELTQEEVIEYILRSTSL